jgi:hypothetical protein
MHHSDCNRRAGAWHLSAGACLLLAACGSLAPQAGGAPAAAASAASAAAAEPASLPPAPPPKVVYYALADPVDIAARHLLSAQDEFTALNPSDLVKEIIRLSAMPQTPQIAMDMALALGYTHNPGDVARAQGLLDQVQRDPSAAALPWHGLARLLAMRYADQRRAEEQVDRLNQQLRDQQRDNQRKFDQLNDKLEALKAIERSLNNRFGPGPGSPGAPASGARPAPKP